MLYTKTFFLIITTLTSSVTFSQIRKAKETVVPLKIIKTEVKQDPEALKYAFNKFKKQQEKWFKFNRVNLNLSEVAFSNWSAGGENSVSALLNGKFRRRYTELTYFWDNELEINYGINAQKGQSLRKTDDKLSLISSFGYRANSKSVWYYSSKFQFLSQISNGYAYPNKENPISKFMAPAYIYLGVGMEYVPNVQRLNLFISPLTLKTTMVLDSYLANKGAFGVERAVYASDGSLIKAGRKTNNEVGFSISGNWKEKIMDNIHLENTFSFYGDYIKNFGNIDMDYDISVNMKINDYVQARLGLHLKYDDEVKFFSYKDEKGVTHDYGSRIQLKQILGIGLSYTF